MTSALAPPCSGPFSAADRGHDRRVDIGQGRRRDAAGERGGVQLVVGVEDQRDVEGADGGGVGPIPGQHVEKIRGVPHHRIGIDTTPPPP